MLNASKEKSDLFFFFFWQSITQLYSTAENDASIDRFPAGSL